MMRLLLVLVCAAFVGCIHGPRLKNFEPSQKPHGIQTTITISESEAVLAAELIAVDEHHVVVATLNEVVRISYARIESARFHDAAHLNIGAERTPGPDKRRQLTLLSRYPQGINEALLARLLEAFDQSDLVEIE